jgi:hypothetical protein
MVIDEQRDMSAQGRYPFIHSFRRYSTMIIAARRSDPSLNLKPLPTQIQIQPPASVFHELISSFEESKQKAQQRRKSRVLSRVPSTASI